MCAGDGGEFLLTAAFAEDSELAAQALKDLKNVIEILVPVGRHVARTDQGTSVRHGRANHWGREHAVLVKFLSEREGLEVVADQKRDDRCPGVQRVVAHSGQLAIHASSVSPEGF